MQVSTWLIVLAGAFILLSASLVVWIFLFFRRLSKDVERGNLVKVLDKVLSKEEENTKSIKSLEDAIEEIKEAGTFHVQKTSLVRYNPFEEMGGEHSFSLVLLNGNDTGTIVTGLHTRDKTRVYVKDVEEGETKVELSNEEEKALKKAIKK